jgi:drug/metabolite transporter (DMT)-like permease
MTTNLWLGIAAALTSAVIGAGWQLASRHGVTTTLGPIEIAVLRYGLPMLVLLPLWARVGWRPKSMSWGHLAVFCAGGLPFGLLVVSGAQFAPAAHIGVFMAGTMPIFTAVAAWIADREPISPTRAGGFAVILAGVGLLGGVATQGLGSWRGDLLFLLASMAWAAHTVAFRRSGLTPWQGAAVANGWSMLALLLLVPFLGAGRLLTAPLGDVLFQAAWQGVFGGLLGLVAFMAAVARLGSARAALSGALIPVLTATGAAWLLGETVDRTTAMAVALVALGVVLASGAFAARTPAPAR